MSLQIREMFDGISRKYDFLNHFLSLGRDIRWRKKAVSYIHVNSTHFADVCGGTGDFLKEISKKFTVEQGVVADFSYGMLEVSRKKYPDFFTVQLDAMKTPLHDASFDVITNGFGMRNLDITEVGIQEAHRMLKQNGQFITLEFFQPSNPFSFFFYKMLAPAFIPIFGAFFSGKKSAYEYLVRSIKGFLKVKDYAALCEKNGFSIDKIHVCDGGIAHIVVCSKK